jgi:hypothetical protein
VAHRRKGTCHAAQYHRIAARRGKGRAVVAVGHALLLDEQEREHLQRRLVHRLERLGFAVTREALPLPT